MFHPSPRQSPWLLTAAILGCALGGCVVGPKYHAPSATVAPPPPAYKEAATPNVPAPAAATAADPTAGGLGVWTPAQPQDAQLRGKWWEIYNDAELNALEEQLNIDNQNIKQSFENFMAARAMIRESRAQLFPAVGANPSYAHSHSSANVSGGTTSSLIDLPIDVSWEPDLWGKIRNTVHLAQYSAQVSAADLENERLTEQANLAIYFFELRGQDALQQILQATVAGDQKSLELVRAQYETGVVDKIAVVQAQNALDAAQSQATNLGLARAQYEHAIATLIGKPASEFSLPVKPLLATPPPIPVGLPSQLLERRPDIAAAERSMAAANAQIGIAYAAYYPSLTLSASGALESKLWKNLLDWPSRVWSMGPSASETIFDGGSRRATVNQYTAVYNADLAGYRQTVLTALQQVEDALSNLRILTQQIEQQHRAVESAQEVLTLETSRYEMGLDPYIDVVSEQNTLLAARQTLAQLEIQRMTASVQLVEALGGGWDRAQLPTTQQLTAKPSPAGTALRQ
jgi:NodT family efflux transporter outer membrane factor (OMF) lipoprotein